jgi:hypothetical protein
MYWEEHSQVGELYPWAGNSWWYAQSVCASLEKFYKRPMMLTAGYFLGQQHKVFYTPLEGLKARLLDKREAPINLHVWVTLPNFTVVDPTIIPALRVAGAEGCELEKDIFIRNVADQRADQKCCYQPVLVGPAFWEEAKIRPTPMGLVQ